MSNHKFLLLELQMWVF